MNQISSMHFTHNIFNFPQEILLVAHDFLPNF